MQNKKIIIGLVGKIASGKGLVAKYLRDKHNASYYHFSVPLREVLNILHLEINRKNMQMLFIILQKEFGKDFLSNAINEKIKKDKSKIIIIDGIRMPDDVKCFKKILGFKLVAIESDIKTRYKRIIKRGENIDDNKKTFKQFVKDNEVETELHISDLIKKANIKINNNGSPKELYKQIDKIMN